MNASIKKNPFKAKPADKSNAVITNSLSLFLEQHRKHIILFLDEGLNITNSNAVAEDYFKLGPNKLKKHTLLDLFHRFEHKLEIDNSLKALIGRYPIISQQHILSHDQGIVWHLLPDPQGQQLIFIAEPFKQSPNELVAQDIIDAKEKAEAANRAKLDFLANMSHELRNALNGILGMAQILTMRNLPPDTQDYVRDIYQSGNHLLSLVSDMLDFAKLEAGHLSFNVEPFNLRKLANEIVSSLSKQCEKQNLDLILDYCDTVPRYVIGDANRLRQVIINLISNAIKFTPSGHILVSVDPIEVNNDKAIIQILIQDTGIGIPPDKVASVFERFAQVKGPSNHNKMAKKGTGLGLAIVKQLIESMGGEIGIESKPHRGTTFWINLPLQLQAIETEEPSCTQEFTDHRVCIADDNTKRGSIVAKQFSGTGHISIPSNLIIKTLRDASQSGEAFGIVLIDDQIDTSPDIIAAEILADKQIEPPMLCILAQHKNLGKYAQHFYYETAKPINPAIFTRNIAQTYQAWQQEQDTQGAAQPLKSNQLQILLVEDNLLSQKVASIMFEELGCKVTLAENGEETLRQINEPFDIIFLDIGLPDMDGCELAREIQSRDNINSNTPLIALTAHALEADKQQFMKSGMKDVLTKPITFDSAQQTLLKWTQKVAHEVE